MPWGRFEWERCYRQSLEKRDRRSTMPAKKKAAKKPAAKKAPAKKAAKK
jgi:hypothetical protein